MARRLGPRHDLRLSLHNFHAIFSVRIAAPGYINLEKTRALIFYVRSVLRSRDRFCHRLLVLVDSKVVTGAVTKGRSSSVPLSGLLRRLAALCFAGGLLLHCVCVPKSHNPGDWSSRGLRLPGRRSRLVAVSWCPASGVAAQRHPLHMSKRLRGKGFSCGAAAFATLVVTGGRRSSWISCAGWRSSGIEDCYIDLSKVWRSLPYRVFIELFLHL